MQPSSLVFVIIVGIWAAFFVQYWVRRREHIATARSVDAFTETMRVLQVRDPSPSVEMTDRPRSYAVSPARPARPAVTVKRAGVDADRGADGADRRGFDGRGADGRGANHVHGDEGYASDNEWRRGGLLGTLDSIRAGVLAVRHAPRAPRGLTFLVGLLGTVAFGVLSLLGILLAWAPLVPLGMAVFGFAWLRADVRASERARREERGRALNDSVVRRSTGPVRSGVGQRGRAGASAARGREGRPARADEVGFEGFEGFEGGERGSAGLAESVIAETAQTTEDTAAAEAGPAVDPRDLVFDVSAGLAPTPPLRASDAAARGGRRPLLDEDDMPLTWDPVPVPKPTYTMKAKATRVPVPPVTASAAPAGMDAEGRAHSSNSVSAGRPSARAAADLTADDWDDDVPEFFPSARRATG